MPLHKLAIYTHSDCLDHDTGLGHPECADRLRVILDSLERCDFRNRLTFVDAPLGTEAQILRAHSAEHLQWIRDSAPTNDSVYLDGDTVMSPGSLNAALRAVGAGCQAVDDVMQGKYRSAFCAVRPPGHHATRQRAMGFCIFNNIAIAALYALERHGLQRVAVVDFDVHHGNGSEDILVGEPRLFYISTHQSPFYPGTGQRSEGNILNVPLPAATGGMQYRRAFERTVLPALRDFKPELVLASAGFDAHRDDPLAGLALVEDDYYWIGRQLKDIADRYGNGRIISFLEGGYNLEALGNSVVQYLQAFV